MGIKEVENRIHSRQKLPPFDFVTSRPVRIPVRRDLHDVEFTDVNIIDDDQIGEVTQFYYRTKVAVLSLSKPIRIGDKVNILGYTTDLVQRITSLQIEHQPVKTADCGQEVAMRVDQRVRRGDKIFKVAE
jgi:hypothetical protein